MKDSLTGESALSAVGVARLLGALSVSAAEERRGLRQEILQALVEALQSPTSQLEVKIEWKTQKVEDVLYEVLLQVAGMPG